MESEKLGPRARDPHLAVASVSFRVPAVQSEARGSGRVSTASPQPSPTPHSPAPPRRLDGSLLLVQVPAFRWFGPLTQPPLLIRSLDSAFFQKKKKKKKGWDSEPSGKGTKMEGQVRGRGRE